MYNHGIDVGLPEYWGPGTSKFNPLSDLMHMIEVFASKNYEHINTSAPFVA